MHGITRAKGFKAAGINCGIKKSGKLDLALIFSQNLATSLGLFTANKAKAAPLLVTAKHLSNHKAQAIIINSGNANCFTGDKGLKDAKKMASLTAKTLNIDAEDVLVASTGIIAKPLPINKISSAIPKLCSSLSRQKGRTAAYAIQTTDTKLKQAWKTFKIDSKIVSIGAMAKGAGMIAPKLEATMLCFITTDVDIVYPALKKSLVLAVEESFNLITVDGCMSTNDMVLILANGQANNKKIKLKTKEFHIFTNALTTICKDLAKKIVEDGEGATKLIKIVIKGARSSSIARQAGLAIANSLLFKTACFGKNRNIGRIIAALGQTGICLDENRTKIILSSLKKKDVSLVVDLKKGNFSSVVYTSDLTPAYVKINAGYS